MGKIELGLVGEAHHWIIYMIQALGLVLSTVHYHQAGPPTLSLTWSKKNNSYRAKSPSRLDGGSGAHGEPSLP